MALIVEYNKQVGSVADSTPGIESSISFFIEDKDMKVTDMLITGAVFAVPVSVLDRREIPIYMGKGSKFEEYYNDDFSDNVSKIALTMKYLYIPSVING